MGRGIIGIRWGLWGVERLRGFEGRALKWWCRRGRGEGRRFLGLVLCLLPYSLD